MATDLRDVSTLRPNLYRLLCRVLVLWYCELYSICIFVQLAEQTLETAPFFVFIWLLGNEKDLKSNSDKRAHLIKLLVKDFCPVFLIHNTFRCPNVCLSDWIFNNNETWISNTQHLIRKY